MPTIKIDDKDYDIDDLSEEAKKQIVSLQYVDSELGKLNLQIAAMQTAKIAYARALKSALGENSADEEIEIVGDSLSFD